MLCRCTRGDRLTTRGWAPPDDADAMALALAAAPVPEAAALALDSAPGAAMTGAGSCPLLVPLNVNCTFVGRTPVWPFAPMTLKAVTLQSTILLSGEHLECCLVPASQHRECEAVQCCLLTGCTALQSLCVCITVQHTRGAYPGPVLHSAGKQGRQLGPSCGLSKCMPVQHMASGRKPGAARRVSGTSCPQPGSLSQSALVSM